MKPKGVSTQMKALDEYNLMVLFVLLLKRVHVFATFVVNWNRENTAVIQIPLYSTYTLCGLIWWRRNSIHKRVIYCLTRNLVTNLPF